MFNRLRNEALHYLLANTCAWSLWIQSSLWSRQLGPFCSLWLCLHVSVTSVLSNKMQHVHETILEQLEVYFSIFWCMPAVHLLCLWNNVSTECTEIIFINVTNDIVCWDLIKDSKQMHFPNSRNFLIDAYPNLQNITRDSAVHQTARRCGVKLQTQLWKWFNLQENP